MTNTATKIETRADYRDFLAADLAAAGMDRWRFDDQWRAPVVKYMRLLRRVEYLRTRRGATARILRFWARFRMQAVGVRTGITLPPGVAGPGVSIAHYGTLVVNTRAKIGAGTRLHPGVTIGIANGGVPQIGERVYIGPNAVLYGGITVGDEAVIGANSVVNRDVPAGVTVAGSPAKVIAKRGSAERMPAGSVDADKQTDTADRGNADRARAGAHRE
ncbi:serine O-acetyltransferase [Microbacterium sp. NPDC007973]|uniref:serine O-acetyltransferase n=1 Tax=Microbacterium sp. NPDC007973 TaxID=3364182 RepID=UPI0036EAB27E